jgi:hypothetical protein
MMPAPDPPTTADALIHQALLALTRGDMAKAAALLDEAEHLILAEQEKDKAA